MANTNSAAFFNNNLQISAAKLVLQHQQQFSFQAARPQTRLEFPNGKPQFFPGYSKNSLAFCAGFSRRTTQSQAGRGRRRGTTEPEKKHKMSQESTMHFWRVTASSRGKGAGVPNREMQRIIHTVHKMPWANYAMNSNS
jgi:hypothetical protein